MELRGLAALVTVVALSACGSNEPTAASDPTSGTNDPAITPDSPGEWSAPEPLGSVGLQILSAPAVAAAADRVVVVWARAITDGAEVWSRSWTPADGWSAPMRIGTAQRALSASTLRLELDASGSGFAAWVETAENEERLVVCRYSGARWARTEILERQAFRFHFLSSLDLHVEPGGNAIVARSTDDGMRAFAFTSGRWSPPIVAVTRDETRRCGSVAVALHGRIAVVTWALTIFERILPPDPPPAVVTARRIDLGSGVAEEATITREPSAATAGAWVDASGRAHVLSNWSRFARSMRYEPGGAWQEPDALPDMVRDAVGRADGSLTAVFAATGANAIESLAVRRWTPEEGWSPTEPLPAPSSVGIHADLRLAGATPAAFVLMSTWSDTPRLARREPTRWLGEDVPGPSKTMRPSCASEASPCLSDPSRLAVTPDGAAWVVWQQRDAPNEHSIWAQRRLPGTP